MTRMSPTRIVLVVIYLLLALAGLAGTWYFNFQFTPVGNQTYFQAWFANAASSSAAIDVIVTAVVASIVIVIEGWRIGWKWSAVLVPFVFIIALAFVFPLFLATREVMLSRRPRTQPSINTNPTET